MEGADHSEYHREAFRPRQGVVHTTDERKRDLLSVTRLGLWRTPKLRLFLVTATPSRFTEDSCARHRETAVEEARVKPYQVRSEVDSWPIKELVG